MVVKTLISVLLFFFIGYSLGAEVRITNEVSFSDFVNNVNFGLSNYSGTTVFLNSDLSLSGYIINPIGYDYYYQFNGVFDGQGYIISNLNITNSSLYSGLFGYPEGLIIRNIVLDSSCSITNTHSGYNWVYVGGIIGYCSGQCNIENNVNIANITFSGSISGCSLYLGGIVGFLQSYSGYASIVKNCANYGSVTKSETGTSSYIGGIVGFLRGSYPNYAYTYIYNCLNYGTITHNGTASSNLYLGGIAGKTKYIYIENCVSAGKISSPSKSYHIGSLVGYVNSETYINYCYYTDELSGFSMYDYGIPRDTSNTLSYNSNTFELIETIFIGNYSGISLIGALNAASDYYILRGYSHWLLNKNNKNVNFTINGRANPINMDYQILLLNIVSEGNLRFNGWYNDSEYESVFIVSEIVNDISLYGIYEINTNNYTITFDTRGGSLVDPISAQFGANISLPNSSTKDSCTIGSWENTYGDNVGFSLIMPAYNITLYAVWKCTHIKTPDEFLDFSKVVNFWISNYSGTTIFLDSDLSLSGYTTINPIGYSSDYQFRGVFDGQGYVISNLTISSSLLEYMGLFGYSNGLTIRNVVLDSSCSITSSYSGFNYRIYVGGIIGYCYNRCNIENNVNMANVSFTGSISGNSYKLHLGGIVGYLESSRYLSTMKNCANYGSITLSGTNEDIYIGGIVGSLSNLYKYVYNCLNYGTIMFNGTTLEDLYLGSIVGRSSYAYIENCVGAGKISSNNNTYIGGLVGYVDYRTYINYSYYTNAVGNYSIYGIGTPESEFNTPNFPSCVNQILITYLNNQVTSGNGWSKWLLNSNNKTIVFKVNNNIGFSLSSQIILLPDLVVNNSFVFSGWYTDPYYNIPFQLNEVSENITLYSLYGEIINVIFNATGGSMVVTSKSVSVNNSYGELPTPNKIGYTFAGWFTGNNENITSKSIARIASDHTLYAQWTINKYTLIFNFNNGTEPEERILGYNSSIIYPNITEREGYTSNGWDKEVSTMPTNNLTITALWIPNNYTVFFNVSGGDKLDIVEITVTFNESYGELPTPNKTEHTFIGWFTEDNENITSESIVKIASNHTLYARWTINKYTVTFNFNNGTDPEERIFDFNSPINYPVIAVREGYTSNGWDRGDIEFMPAENITVTAQWIPNNYTVFLNVNGGDELDSDKITVTFNDTYRNLPIPTRENYLFAGWLTENNKNISNESIVRITSNHTLYARWTENKSKEENTTNKVEIIFNTKDLSKKEIIDAIKQYTEDEFTITCFENSLDEIKVIIEFNDVEGAIRFTEKVKSTNDSATKNIIKDIKYSFSNAGSFSLLPCPFVLFTIFIL